MKSAKTYKYDKNEYIKRIKIEHVFSKIKLFKRIIIRYDKYIKTFSGFVYLALSLSAIKIINNT